MTEAGVAARPTPTAAGWRSALDVVSEPGRFGRSVGVVALVGLALRLILQRFEPLPPTHLAGFGNAPLVADETWYVRVADNLLHGRGFVFYPGHETALHGPLTVLLLLPAAILQPHGYALQRATMAVVGAAAIVAIAYAARELGGGRVGLLAAVLAALYPGLWVNDLVATSESSAVALLGVVLYLSLRYRREPRGRVLVLLGLSLGLLALDRGELSVLGLLLAVPAVVAVARRHPAPLAAAVRGLLVVAALAVAVVVPWSAYNEARFHQTVLISNDLGQTLVGANCPESYYGKLTGYDGRYCFLPVALAEVRAQPRANEAQADAWFRSEAVTYALHHWTRWPLVGAFRELWLWSLWEPGWTVFMSGVYIGRPEWIAWSQIVAFWLLAPLALAGLVLARRRRARVAELVTMVAFTAALGLLVVGHLRYRIPAEVAWVVLAAVALDRLVEHPGTSGARAPVSSLD
jgi:4-amino-4-deoxy-L-arabinose transferase-like glycosyltransferase